MKIRKWQIVRVDKNNNITKRLKCKCCRKSQAEFIMGQLKRLRNGFDLRVVPVMTEWIEWD